MTLPESPSAIAVAVLEVWLFHWHKWVSTTSTIFGSSLPKSGRERANAHKNIILSNLFLMFCDFVGAKISASDISDSMANEAARRAGEMGLDAEFYTSDLESVEGKYDTVTCVDVAIHYPTDKMAEMVGHLCSLSEDRVIISFAPKTWYYELLKKIGELFPGPSKTTRAYLHEEEVVRNALSKAGFKVAREEMTGTNFYFSRLLEAKRV